MLNALLKMQKRDLPVVLVAPGPVFGFKLVDELQSIVSRNVVGPYLFDLEGWSANPEHLLLFLLLMGNANVIVLSGDIHYGFTSTAKFSVFDDKMLREALKYLPSGVTLPTTPSGTSPTYNFQWAANFIQLTSSALKNFASDTAVKIPAGLTTMAPGLFLLEEGGTVRGKYEQGEFFEWFAALGNNPAQFTKTKKEDLKPSSLFRQRINDAFNSPYISQHNIGLLRIETPEISNVFYTSSGRVGERSWTCANDKYWE